MRRVVILVRFRDQATPPEGEPPRFTVHGQREEVTVLAGDAGDLASGVTYDTQVTLTGETSFGETGHMTFGSSRIGVTAVGEGTLAPGPGEGLFEGAVIWRLDDGEGGLAGASGLATSSFTVDLGSGSASEHQIVSLLLPS
jgi:hypothetical protein